MTNKENTNTEKKGFLKKLMEKLDRKLEEKAQKTSCCSSNKDNTKGSSCC